MNIDVIELNGQRLLTSAQLAEIYGTSTDNIKQNFKRNKSHYKEGKHFILLKGEELRRLKENCHLVGRNANKLYLWTERGAILHAKSLNTDEAWEAYDKLIEFYFSCQTKKYMVEDKLTRVKRFIAEAEQKRALLLQMQEQQ